MNKNISIWRGDLTPPTNNHLWVKENNSIYLHNGVEWDPVIDQDAYETLLDYLEHKEDFPKIDIVTNITTSSLKNGEFQIYEIDRDFTPSDYYDYGRTASFKINAGDLCLIGKVTSTPESSVPESPMFSRKYAYKIRFRANPNYYFGGTGTNGANVLTTPTGSQSYSLIGHSDRFLIACGRYYLYFNNSYLSYTIDKALALPFKLKSLGNYYYEIVNYTNNSQALNADLGLGTPGDYSDKIGLWNTGDVNNAILFLPVQKETIIKRIISTGDATLTSSGLMSSSDKNKLDKFLAASNYKTKQTAKNSPSATDSSNTYQFIDTISQDSNGVITATKKNVRNVTTELSGLMLPEDKTKLDKVTLTMIDDLTNDVFAKKTELDKKVDQVSGKQLSTEDFTTELKTKLDGLYPHSLTSKTSDSTTINSPSNYSGKLTMCGKDKSAHPNLNNEGDYHAVVGIHGFEDNNKGDSHELIFTGKGNIYHRNGKNTENPSWNNDNHINLDGTQNTSGYNKLIESSDLATASLFGIVKISDSYSNSDSNTALSLKGINDFKDKIMSDIENSILNKQDIISDLDTIRSGASAGATAVLPSSLATVATSGSYEDLTNKPTIPNEVTESTVSGWGFTKNEGTYSKPSGGIPKSDLDSAVQTSLGKADTALQSYTEQYQGTITGITMNGTSKGTSGVVDLGTVLTEHQSLGNYYTKFEIDQQLGDINSILESIING